MKIQINVPIFKLMTKMRNPQYVYEEVQDCLDMGLTQIKSTVFEVTEDDLVTLELLNVNYSELI